jgi:hypothetical protein
MSYQERAAAKEAAKKSAKSAKKPAATGLSKFKAFIAANPKSSAKANEAAKNIERAIRLLNDVANEMKAAKLPDSAINAMWKSSGAHFK